MDEPIPTQALAATRKHGLRGDARANDDNEPSYPDFRVRETKRVRDLTKATLDELLQSNQLTDDEGYYYLQQLDNFARFCALGIRCGKVKQIALITASQWGEDTDDADSRMETLRRDLNTRGITLKWQRKNALHDREVHFDNGWVVKIGRGLDIYYKPETWVSIEAADFSLRRCRQTKVDIYRKE